MLLWSLDKQRRMLSEQAADSVTEGWLLRLFTTDAPITRLVSAGDLTEATFPGYEPLPPGPWDDPFIEAGTLNAVMVATEAVLFERDRSAGDPQTVYGWYVTDQDGILLLAERFPDVMIFAHPFDSVQVQIKLTLGVCPLP
jgi:hypothetical protein